MTSWHDEFSMNGPPRRLGATLFVEGRVVAMVGPVGTGYGAFMMGSEETRTFPTEEGARKWAEEQLTLENDDVDARWGTTA